ncbi:MAG: cobalt ECF transporter T component CbiQ [Acidimicrobiia bacterium]|nr:cobalt ECF transporter T component CbiQ [Acidimicrobiia bacterium]
MSGPAHSHALFVHGHSPVHRLPAHLKLIALVIFITAVVVTPRDAFWAFAVLAVLLGVGIVAAELPMKLVGRRMLVEVPFVLFAVALPFLGGGDRVDVLGIAMSEEGLWAAWTILAKATLGVGASVLLSSTTEIPQILSGMQRLRVPRVLTAITGFMVRYLDVIIGELSRRRIAMASRGYEARWMWQGESLAASAASIFVRSYERGERVHQAMVARGYAGTMPTTVRVETVEPAQWVRGLGVPAIALAVAIVAVVL